MSITTVNNNLVHYEVLGRGQPLLFVHGWLGSWRYWWPSMQALSAQHRSFAFDLWGFGDSSKASHMYSLAAYVEMIEQFITQLGIMAPVTLIGHSLGAAVALRYALEYPNNVEKLALVALPVQGSAIHPRLTNSDPDSIINRIIGKSNSFSEVDSELRKTDVTAVNQLAAEIQSQNFANDLANCARPTLMVFGTQDTIVPPPVDNLLNKGNNNRYVVPLDDCNHFPMLQEKAKFNRLLMDFIHASAELTELTPKEYWQRRTR